MKQRTTGTVLVSKKLGWMKFAVVFLTAVLMLAAAAAGTVRSSEATYAANNTFKGFYFDRLIVNTDSSKPSFTKSYFNPATGNTTEINAYTFSVDSADYAERALTNDGDPVLKASVYITGEYMTEDTPPQRATMDYSFELPVHAKNVTGVQGRYAVLTSATVNGTTYKGGPVSNVDFYDIKEAGIYKFNPDVQIECRMGDMSTFTYGESHTLTGSDRVKNLYDTFSTSSAELNSLNMVFQTEIVLDEDQMLSFSDNLNISEESRTYDGESDFRNLVSLHSDAMPQDNASFTFSTAVTDYNVSSSDLRFFKPFGRGVGYISEQSENVESGANASLTNFNGLFRYFRIRWYRVERAENEKIYTLIDDAESVSDAGAYCLRIEPKANFSYGFTPVKIVMGGKLYEQELTIEKRALYVDLNNEFALDRELYKEYDRTTDADILFSNINVSKSAWTDYMNGFPEDYDALNNYFTGSGTAADWTLFSFSGSEFATAAIGDNKTVYLQIAMRDIAYSIQNAAAYRAVNNHRIVPVLGTPGPSSPSEYTFDKLTPIASGAYAGKYNLGSVYRIIPNTLKVNFAQENDEDATPFQNTITYGDKERIGDYVFNDYMVTTGTVIRDGLLMPENLDDWKLVFQNNEPKLTVDTACNTVYIVIKMGKKKEPGDTAVTVYVDGEGNEYSAYSGKLFAGVYYFYYELHAVYTNGRTERVDGTNGRFSVKSSSGSDVLDLDMSLLQNLIINKKKLDITVTDITLVKDYDGTDYIADFAAEADGILASDEGLVVQFRSSAAYAYVGAGDSVPIDYVFELAGVAGQQQAVIRQVIDSYEIDVNSVINATNHSNINTGRINRLDLTVEFVETEYSRMYNTLMYVAVRVGEKGIHTGPDGRILTEDYYYYYESNEEANRGRSGYCPESDLSLYFENCAYIKLAVGGFLDGEGFAWNKGYYPVEDFMLNKTMSDPDNYFPSFLVNFNLLSWLDTSRAGAPVPVNRLTASSDTSSDKYRLELSDEETLPNYRLIPKPGSYAYLLINKLDVSADDIKIYEQNSENYLEYNGQSNDARMFLNGKINFENHKEYDQIMQLVGGSPESMTTVLSFASACSVAGHDHDFAAADIDGMTLAGEYYVELTIPSTRNYNAYTVSFYVSVNTKTVDVYVTFPFRVYGDEELKYEGYRYIDDIADHTVKANTDGEIVGDDDEGNTVYVYGKDLTSGNLILYSGFIDGETITLDGEEENAFVTINLSPDAAGTHQNAVQVSGAMKHNYNFRYHNENLYVKKKPLSVYAAPEQSKDYTGREVMPDYTITGGAGVLAMYVVGYNGVMDDVEDETRTSVVNAGEYVVKVYAKPDAASGASASNYDVSEERLTVKLTVKKTMLQPIPGTDSDTSPYDGKAYELGNFNRYFQGIGSAPNFAQITAQPEWGTVTLQQATKDNMPHIGDIVDSGRYVLTVLAEISNTENVYFSPNGVETTELTFEIELTVEKSARINFTTTASEGVEAADGGFKMEYRGEEAAFGYNLNVLGQDYSNGEINVIISVNDYLYAINQNVYATGDPVYNEAAAQSVSQRITGVNYNIGDRSAMLNTGSYTVKYYINNRESFDYNENFVSAQYDYTFTINRKGLRVYIAFEEGYGPYKIYRESNESVERHAYFTYDGWVGDEGRDEAVVSEITAPTIDWSGVAEDAYVSGSYNIRSQGGSAPANYYFDHSWSELEFKILRAESWIIVYGFYDEEKGIYTDYSVYNGTEQKPQVLRMAGDEPIDPDEEVIGSDGISIRLAGLFVGADKNNITDGDILPYDACKDVGRYVFEISVVASANYNAVEPRYYYLEITKARLEMFFADVTGDTAVKAQGYAGKIYDGSELYPAFKVIYEGFVGDDAGIPLYLNPYDVYHIDEYDPERAGVKNIELMHPYYEIFGADGSAFNPRDVGSYSARVVFGEDYGVAKNYEIVVRYVSDDQTTFYPTMEITRRPVDVKPGDTVQKVYDATDKIKDGLIKSNNYRFVKTLDNDGREIENSGVIGGDVIDMRFDLTLSRFERKDVHDENGEMTIVYIRIYGFDITNANYRLDISETFTDEKGEYFLLRGSISQASADIRFTDENGDALTGASKLEIVYDAKRHPVLAIVNGVLLENGAYEEVEYNIVYRCAAINYDSATPPINAQSYEVTLSVTGSNYSPVTRQLDLVILKAEVEIVFGGDVVQTYGSVLGGLTAVAGGVGGYTKVLTVGYYDANGEPVPDIITAFAGVYSALAVHEESANFKHTEKTEIFTIKRRAMVPAVNVRGSYSYTGRPVETDIYFDFNGVRYNPSLLFDIMENGAPVPFNYGDSPVSNGYPSEAGTYRVSCRDDMSNFEIAGNYWTNFEISPIALTVSVADITVTTGISFDFTFVVAGSVNGEDAVKALTSMPSVEYFDSAGSKLSSAPDTAGVYLVRPYGASSRNYILKYDYGVLTLNKPLISQQSPSNLFAGGEVIVEGSFNADTTLVVRAADNIRYNQMVTAFDLYKYENNDFLDYAVAAIYYLRLSDGNVKQSDGGMMTVKIYAKGFFDGDHTYARAAETSEVYYVARMSADGSVTILEARREGDSLVFETDSLATFALLADKSSISAEKNLDWLLYVGIAAGVVLIGVALLIVKLRA